MELAFQKSAVAHLQKLTDQVIRQEETTETTVPDSMPDVGRIVGCWGVPVVRSKEWRQDSMTLSGGVSAWILYVPEDGATPRQLGAYLPFSMKWDLPQSDQEGFMRVSCRLRSIDARMLSARRILVRASIACQGDAYRSGEAQFYTLPEPPKNLEVLRQRLPLLLPVELTEKSFLLDEELELSGGAPAVSQIIAYQLRPVISDGKVLGEKAVFKGDCALHLVYMTPEERLAVWDFEVPFSQYTELEQNYDQEEELQVEPLLTGAEVTADEDGRRLRLKCSVAAQCMVLGHRNVDLVQDLYSLRGEVVPQTQSFPAKSRLDHQTFREQAEESFPIDGGTLIDGTVLPDFPTVRREGEDITITAPLWCSVLYYGSDGALQSATAHTDATAKTHLAEGCQCQAAARLSGPAQWSVGGGSALLRAGVELTADCFTSQDITMISGGEMGEAVKPDPNRPSLILRTTGQDESLWSLAKRCGSTVEAIRGANHLGDTLPAEDALLLIPVL